MEEPIFHQLKKTNKEKLKIDDIIIDKHGKRFKIVKYDSRIRYFMIKELETEKTKIPILVKEAWKCNNCFTIYDNYNEAYECCD